MAEMKEAISCEWNNDGFSQKYVCLAQKLENKRNFLKNILIADATPLVKDIS